MNPVSIPAFFRRSLLLESRTPPVQTVFGYSPGPFQREQATVSYIMFFFENISQGKTRGLVLQDEEV